MWTIQECQRPAKGARVIFLLLFVAVALSGIATAQQKSVTLAERIQGRVKIVEDDGQALAQLRTATGNIMAEGRENSPAGRYQLTKYRIEELSLPVAIKAESQGRRILVDRAWRVTITGGPFVVGNMPAVIWINDVPVGIGQESPDLRSISTIVFDRSLIKNGASISLSYGDDYPGRAELPEKIDLTRSR